MKKLIFLIFPSLLLLAPVTGCDDALDTIGSEVIGSDFVVKTDMASVNFSAYVPVEKMYYNNDTLLLGEFFDSRYGNVKADALIEVLPYAKDSLLQTKKTPDGLWEDPQFTELILVVNKTLFDFLPHNVPFQISVYHKADTLTVGEKRFTTFDKIQLSQFFSPDSLLGARLIDGDSLISIKLSTELSKKLGARILDKGLNSPDDFRNSKTFRGDIFKGLYLTTSGGKDVLFNLYNQNDTTTTYLALQLLYEYKQFTFNDGTIKKDTTSSTQTFRFPASSRVPRAQRIITEIPDELTDNKTFGFVSSPVGLRPTIEIDLSAIDEKLGDYTNINRAVLTLKVPSEEDIAALENPLLATLLPTPSYLLLIKENEAEDFFKEGKTVDNKTSFRAGRNGNRYQFDIAQYIQQKKNDNAMTGTERFALVPVNANAREKIGLSAVPFYKNNDSIQVDLIFNRLNFR